MCKAIPQDQSGKPVSRTFSVNIAENPQPAEIQNLKKAVVKNFKIEMDGEQQLASFLGNNCSILTHFFLISSESGNSPLIQRLPCRCKYNNDQGCGRELVSYKVKIDHKLSKPQLIGIVPVWFDGVITRHPNGT